MTECTQCENKFSRIGTHWVQSDKCTHPELTQYQEEIVVGLLMGDGCIQKAHKNPRLVVNMVSPNYLQYLDDIFGSRSTGVTLRRTAEENAKQNRDSGCNKDAKAENYSDLYYWQTRNLPELSKFTEWYETGEKVWPDDIELTPITLKHWYCGDGHYNNSFTQNCIKISMSNEVENTEKVDKMFKRSGLPVPSNYNTSGDMCDAQFTVSQSRELLDYMGESLPDFEYKWPKDLSTNGPKRRS